MAYEGSGRAVVGALKFRGRLALADLMAAQIAANAPPGIVAGTLVPIPPRPTAAAPAASTRPNCSRGRWRAEPGSRQGPYYAASIGRARPVRGEPHASRHP